MGEIARNMRDRGAAIFAAASARAATLAARLRPSAPAMAPLVVLTAVLWLTAAVSNAVLVSLLLAVAAGLAIAARGDPVISGAPSRQAGMPSRSTGEAGWRAIIDALPDATIVLGESGDVLHYNAGASELFPGLKAAQPVSRATRNPVLIDAIERAGKQTGEAVVVQLAERIPIERRLAASAIRLSGIGRVPPQQPAMLVTFRDLSEQDKLAQMREDFIANASHELRTPLASLKGFLETLQGPARNDDGARDRFLAMMASQAERMSRLIDDLLSLSRIEMREHLLPRGIVELNEVAGYALQTLEPLAETAGVEIALLPLGRPARIRGDRDEIVQVVLNLVQNAIVHGVGGRGGSGARGAITVQIGRSTPLNGAAPRVSIAVSDRGAGIAPEHLPRLTERFYRANAAASRAKGGTGLGLAIVKHIVARHRGELGIASRLGEGSTFTVSFDEMADANSARAASIS